MKRVGLIALFLAVGGCYQHTYHIGAGAPAGAVTYDQWRHHWLWGLVSPDKELELREVCPSGNATILQETHFLNGLVSVLTSGIYSPTTVQVRCAGTSAALDLTPEDVERIVTAGSFLDRLDDVAPHRFAEAEAAQRALADS